ncbi:MAG TPA: hypothetical protein VLE49_20085 [Anaerolineales bacterium]|nr:hypothetical protein [Anaerolineales bacterium]
MDESQQELFERQLLAVSRGLEYPRTPDIAGSVMRRLHSSTQPHFLARRLARSVILLLILCSSLMLIPPARAAIIEFIQIGAVRIFRAEPTPSMLPNAGIPLTATPGPTSQPLIPMLESLAGETTLTQAQQMVDYPLLLPSYPPDLGQPDRVFVQDADGKMTILVWMDPQQPDKVLMSLHFLPADSGAIKKMDVTVVKETTVNGQRALWTTGPYPLLLSNGSMDFIRLIDGHVLIWAEGDITYRLETNLSLEEAIKVAESLEPIR